MNRHPILAGTMLLAALACVPSTAPAETVLRTPLDHGAGPSAPAGLASPTAPSAAEGSGGPPVRIGKPKEIVVVGSKLDQPAANRLLGAPGNPTAAGSGVARYHLENAWPTKSGTERKLASPQQLPTAPATPVAGPRR